MGYDATDRDHRPAGEATSRADVSDGARALTPPTEPAGAAEGWRRPAGRASLAEVYRSVPIRAAWSPLRKMLAFAGPG